jgi:hypothetical protein
VIISPFRKLACALGIMAALLPAHWAGAGSPEQDSEDNTVEMWIGLRRVDVPAKPPSASPASRQVGANSGTSENAPVADWAGGVGMGFIPTRLTATARAELDNQNKTQAQIPVPVYRVPGPKKKFPFLKNIETMVGRTPEPASATSPNSLETREDYEKAVSLPETILVLGKDYAKSGTSEEQTAPPALKGAAVPKQNPAPVETVTASRNNPEAFQSFMSTLLLPIAVIFAVAVLTPIVSIVCFFALLRRHCKRFGPLFGFAHGGAATMIGGPISGSPLDLAERKILLAALERSGKWGDGGNMTSPVPDETEGHVEKFDMGPSLQEERLNREKMAEQQEQAVLQKIFEDNLRLQEQIEQNEQATAPAPEQ